MRNSAEEIAVATAELAVLIAKSSSLSAGGAARVAYDLGKLAHGIRVLAEIDCNTGLTPAQEKRRERLREKIAGMVREVSPSIRVESGGDARGYPVKLHFPEVNGFKPSNSFGGAEEGWGIG